MKQRLIATAIISILWFLLDWLFHGIILMGDYNATASLWRPMEDMKTILMHVTTISTALVFVLIYCQLVKEKTLSNGLKLGILCGLLVGIGMSLGSYSYMPITVKIATIWFVATMTHFTVAGAVVGKIVTQDLPS